LLWGCQSWWLSTPDSYAGNVGSNNSEGCLDERWPLDWFVGISCEVEVTANKRDAGKLQLVRVLSDITAIVVAE
jgi:hypothetical protein